MSDVKYYCLSCNNSVSLEELKALKNCPICRGRFCRECTSEDGTCHSCAEDEPVGFVLDM